MSIRIVIVGGGNIGRAALEAALAAPDMEVAGVLRRTPEPLLGFESIPTSSASSDFGAFDVAILAVPSRSVPEYAEEFLRQGITTVDSFDIHSEIPAVRQRLHAAAVAGNARAVLSAGWDPGSDSILRTLLEAMAPKGITHTNFGPGMSMGHSVAVKAIAGVRDALSVTVPKGEGLHRRMVYVELESGASFDEIAQNIKADPYFVHDETHVFDVPSVDALKDTGHGVHMERKGVSGCTQNQRFSFDMSINNPSLTGQIMISCARAALRQPAPGCYTMIELPTVDMLPGDRDEWVKKLV